MEIKFICTNPACKQRIAVDEAWAGRTLSCPACATALRVPSGKSLADAEGAARAALPLQQIKFKCSHAGCLHLITVDSSQAGRWLKCPRCGRPAHVPGSRVESVLDTVLVEAVPVGTKTLIPLPEASPEMLPGGTVPRLWRLVKGWGLAVAILGLLLGLLALRSRASLPRNLNAMMDEIYFHGEILAAPVINHAGTSLVYLRTVKGGVGVSLVNLNTLERRQIALENSPRPGAVKLLGWSPDDHYLALTLLQSGKPYPNLSLCDGSTGTLIRSLPSKHSIIAGKWLAGNSLIMMDEKGLLFLVNLEPNDSLGQFGRKGFVNLQKLDPSTPWLIPNSDHSVACVRMGAVWDFDLPANRLTPLTQLTEVTVSNLDYTGDNFRYLISAQATNTVDQVLYQYDLRAPRTTGLSLLAAENFCAKGQWIQNGTGIAYLGTNGNRYYLAVRTSDPALRTNLFTARELNTHTGGMNIKLFREGRKVVRSFAVSPQTDKIYTVASVNYEPLAIWEYDIASKTLRNVVPDQERQTCSHLVNPVQAAIIDQNSNRVDYYYLPPAGLKKDKKYPVVMDQFSDLGFQPNSQFLANAGIFYVTVNPYGIGRPEHPTNPDDTLAVYHEILKNPNVDPHRIYLLGESAGTGTVALLLEEHPELWRGAIMLSPVAFPRLDPGTKMCRSIFCSFGVEDDFGTQRRMEKFIHEACGHLVRTQLEYGRAGHTFLDLSEVKKRYQAVATFILTDY
jgi:hypothetical protein